MKKKWIKKTRIYRQLLKLYKLFTQRVYATAYLTQKFYCMIHNEAGMFCGTLIGFDDFVKSHSIEKQLFFNETATEVFDIVYDNDNKISDSVKVLSFPDVYGGIFRDVRVYGGYNIITAGEYIIEPVYSQDSRERWMYMNPLLQVHAGRRAILRYIDSDIIIDKALFLCGCAGGNYYHFMVEILAKLAIAESSNSYRKYPIIIDESVKNVPSLMDALNTINLSKRKIYFASDKTAYQVGKLAYISNTSFQPMNLKPYVKATDGDYLFSVQAMNLIKELVAGNTKVSKHDRIYLARFGAHGAHRRLHNDEEIADLCSRAGFQTIFPERLSFIEQASLFMRADCIIGCGGAALTNVMFCSPGTTVYIITPKEHMRRGWFSYSKTFGLNVFFIDAHIVYKDEYDAGDRYVADLTEIKRVLDVINEFPIE